jgi:hypothetical protein
VWDRDEEFFFDTFDPATVVTIRAGLDGEKKIVSWDYEVIGAGERGAAHFYDIAHHRTMVRGGWNANVNAMHPFGIGPWRAPGANANVFARESHMDLLAAKAGMDPVEFRLLNLKDERMRRVLQEVAQKFGWTPKVAPSRRGFGVACGVDAGTYVASMAQVKVDRNTGAVQVVRVDPRWRLGLAASYNQSDAGDRAAFGLFGGLRTGAVAWLAEVNLVADDGFPEGTRDLLSALLEANWAVRRGHNFKVGAEWFDPDRDVDEDEQTRWSAVYEYSPIQFLQLRGGARLYDGIPQNDLQNRTTYFVEVHGYF